MYYNLIRFNLTALSTTETDDNAIAAPAIIGFNSGPWKRSLKTPAVRSTLD